MSAKIILDNIITSSATASFTDDITFEVTFSALEPTLFPISWKVTYVGSAYSEDYDQVLEEFDIDPIENPGIMKFDIACQSPAACKIPRKELLCVTAIIITASYQSQQFIRVGFYVHNQLTNPTEEVDLDSLELDELVQRIQRNIISDKPRVTKFNINWTSPHFNFNRKSIQNEEEQKKVNEGFPTGEKLRNEQDEQENERCSQKGQEIEKLSTEENFNMIAQ